MLQSATTGGVYRIGVNGRDTGFIYDGNTFYSYVAGGVTKLDFYAETAAFTEGELLTGGTSSATGTIWRVVDDGTTGSPYLTDVTGTFESAVRSSAGSRLRFARQLRYILCLGLQRAALFRAKRWSFRHDIAPWIRSGGGDATEFPLNGVFDLGGSLLFVQRWSLKSGGEGGLSDQNIFVSTQSKVAIYQGVDPGDANTWNMVGVYRIGRPLGKYAFLRGGSDIAISTTVGLVGSP